MNLAQLIDPEHVIAMRERRETKPAEGETIAPVRETKEQRIVSALRAHSLTIGELHVLIGGSRGSLSVYLAQMKGAGKVARVGHQWSAV